MNENIIVPPPLHPLLADRNRGRGRPDSNNRKKNSDKGVFCWGFFATIFFYGSKWSKHLSGVERGATFYYYYFFYFFYFFGGGGGVGGMQILISIETYITCDFSGGGGVRTTYSSLDSRMGKK